MPSRRKSAHTTKIERVPRYEVYHGEEDLDDRLSSDGTLDLSMKRIKVEPPDYHDTRNELPSQSRPSPALADDMYPMETQEHAAERRERAESSASSCDNLAESVVDPKSVADDGSADATNKRDHVTAQVDVLGSIVGSAADEQILINSKVAAVSTQNGLPIFSQSSKGKSVRPFKLYTANRDLLAGLAPQGAPTLATYSVPLALAAVPGAVPLAFTPVPLVTAAPMIPLTASSSTTSAISSADAMGAGTNTRTTSTSSATSKTTAKSTSSTTDAHLMTLATEADKILRERHASGDSSDTNQDSLEGNTAEDLSSSGDETDIAVMVGEEGTFLKIPSLSGKTSNGNEEDSLSFIQKRAVAAAVAATHPHKSKKRRQSLPDQLKDIAYWERRRKNNEAAKRSRDARRAKEDQIAIRAALLEQENIRLKIEVTALKEETVKLRAMLYSNNNS